MPKLSLPFLYSALVTGLLLTSGCTVLGPDYQEPEVSWLNDWQPSAYPVADTKEEQQADDLQFWWQLFNDPELNQLIETVKQENINLRIAGLRILESRALLGIAGSNLYPQVQQASGAANYTKTEQHGRSLIDSSGSQVGYSFGLNAAWELDFWGRFKRGIESADAAYFASIANQQDLQVLLSSQASSLYFAYRTTQARIAIANENVALSKRSFEITELLFKRGADSELDLQQAKTQYLAAQATIPTLESALIQTRNALSVLLGRPPGDLPELDNAQYKLPTIESTSIEDVPTKLLVRRPDIRAAAWQVAAQSAQIGIAEADYYPTISLLGSLGWSGKDKSGSPDIGSLGIGPTLKWNIFDHGRIKNNIRVQDTRLQQLIENYQESVLQAAREVDDAAISIIKTSEAQTLYDQTVTAAKRSLTLATARYREGYSDFQRVLDAQQALFVQADRRLVNHGSHLSSVVNLYKGLGGGWVYTPVENIIPEVTRNTMQQRTDWGDLLTAPIYNDPSNTAPAHEDSPHE
jgi:NodT family efflux transporter outer membrane factor (OMF) lipoprotein